MKINLQKKLAFIFLLLSTLFVFSITAQERESVDSFIANDGASYNFGGNGIVTVKEHNQIRSRFGSYTTGIFNGERIIKGVEDYSWTWTTSHTFENQTEFDETTEEIINVSYRIDTFTGYNNDPSFNITQIWRFDPRKAVKFSFIETNNLGADITDTKFWFTNTLNEGKVLRYDNIEYEARLSDTRHLQGNFNDRFADVDFGDSEFRFFDLINSNFTVTDFYIGNGSILDRENNLILAIGVTKGNGIFSDGVTVILDPEDSGAKSPDAVGSELASPGNENDWSSGTNIKTSNNVRATETTIGDQLNSGNYSFSIPAGSEIVGIEVKIEGHSKANFCGE